MERTSFLCSEYTCQHHSIFGILCQTLLFAHNTQVLNNLRVFHQIEPFSYHSLEVWIQILSLFAGFFQLSTLIGLGWKSLATFSCQLRWCWSCCHTVFGSCSSWQLSWRLVRSARCTIELVRLMIFDFKCTQSSISLFDREYALFFCWLSHYTWHQVRRCIGQDLAYPLELKA